VLVLALFLFNIINDGTWQYRALAIVIVSVGILSSIFYAASLNEPYLVAEAKRLNKEFKLQ
jgi:Na+/melibiose symporter-like transporter